MICFQGVDLINERTAWFVMVVSIASWLLLSIIILSKMLLPMRDNKSSTVTLHTGRLPSKRANTNILKSKSWRYPLHVILLCVAISHLWAFFRLRKLQKDMVSGTGHAFVDGLWSFGQIVAVSLPSRPY